jgi:hypothetical protein
LLGGFFVQPGGSVHVGEAPAFGEESAGAADAIGMGAGDSFREHPAMATARDSA